MILYHVNSSTYSMYWKYKRLIEQIFYAMYIIFTKISWERLKLELAYLGTEHFLFDICVSANPNKYITPTIDHKNIATVHWRPWEWQLTDDRSTTAFDWIKDWIELISHMLETWSRASR